MTQAQTKLAIVPATNKELADIIKANRDNECPAVVELRHILSRVEVHQLIINEETELLNGFMRDRDTIELRIEEQEAKINDEAEVLESISNHGASMGRILKSVPSTTSRKKAKVKA